MSDNGLADHSNRRLKAVEIKGDPMTLEELQRRGNALLAQAWTAAVEALAASTRVNIYHRPNRLGIRAIRDLRSQADDAIRAWTRVSGALGEIEREFERSTNG